MTRKRGWQGMRRRKGETGKSAYPTVRPSPQGGARGAVRRRPARMPVAS